MGKLDGKVAFVTGAARGQGRSHAITLAREGADIIASDICAQIDSVPYRMSTSADLAETAKLVENLDRRIVSREADVRDYDQVKAVVDAGLAEFGHIDVVCANAGIAGFGTTWELSEQQWQDMLGTNLTGIWHATKATVPPMIERDRGGAIVLTSSTAGLKGLANTAHYTAAKHGVVGLMRTLANELAPHNIRVNCVHPTVVNTDMVQNEATYGLFVPDVDQPTQDQFAATATELNALPTPWVEASDISNAILWLVSDEARYVTGVTLPVDAGFMVK